MPIAPHTKAPSMLPVRLRITVRSALRSSRGVANATTRDCRPATGGDGPAGRTPKTARAAPKSMLTTAPDSALPTRVSSDRMPANAAAEMTAHSALCVCAVCVELHANGFLQHGFPFAHRASCSRSCSLYTCYNRLVHLYTTHHASLGPIARAGHIAAKPPTMLVEDTRGRCRLRIGTFEKLGRANVPTV